jgi:hypothetical protein
VAVGLAGEQVRGERRAPVGGEGEVVDDRSVKGRLGERRGVGQGQVSRRSCVATSIDCARASRRRAIVRPRSTAAARCRSPHRQAWG